MASSKPSTDDRLVSDAAAEQSYELPADFSLDVLPRHVAMIMDGNGRWAQQRGLPRIEGHRRGVDTVRMVCETAVRLRIDTLTLYCLSSENWKRPQQELDFLMQLLRQYMIEERKLIRRHGMRLRVIGRRDRLPDDVIEEIDRTTEMAEGNSGTRLVLAIDYGSRDELTAAVRRLAVEVRQGRLEPDAIDADQIEQRLYTAGLPDPDLLIRTGGELRVSNFLLWQISYAELWVTSKAWPEFTQADLLAALTEYAGRHRRFGGL